MKKWKVLRINKNFFSGFHRCSPVANDFVLGGGEDLRIDFTGKYRLKYLLSFLSFYIFLLLLETYCLAIEEGDVGSSPANGRVDIEECRHIKPSSIV